MTAYAPSPQRASRPRTAFPDDVLDLARRFEDRSLPASEWTHRAHLRVALHAVLRRGAAGARDHLRRHIRAFNEALGNENTDHSGYHETVTTFYVFNLSAFAMRNDDTRVCAELFERLDADPISHRDFLHRHYSPEALDSVEARRGWVAPNLLPRQSGSRESEESVHR